MITLIINMVTTRESIDKNQSRIVSLVVKRKFGKTSKSLKTL